MGDTFDRGHHGRRFTRRQVLQLVAGTTAMAFVAPRLLAGSHLAAGVVSETAHGFLTPDELAILDAAMAVILPTDGRPGAREIGIVDYVQSLLSFMPGSDANCDRRVGAADVVAAARKTGGEQGACAHGGDVNGDGSVDETDVVAAEAAVFRARPVVAGGPFSGRQPQDHSFYPIGNDPCHLCHGATSSNTGSAAGAQPAYVYPPNAFRDFVPLTRLQLLSWKVRIFGRDAVPPANNPLLDPLLDEVPDVGLRQKYQEGLALLEAKSRQPPYNGHFVDLSPAQQTEVLYSAPSWFVDLLNRHAIEGTLCVPEYGGNRDRLGWQLAGFDGDSQPLGYVVYDDSAPGGYRETQLPSKPNFGPNPGETFACFGEAMTNFLNLISIASEGGRLNPPNPGVGA